MTKSAYLDKFYEYISNRNDEKNIYIPKIWSKYVEDVENENDVVVVNESEFYKKVIDKIYDSKTEMDKDISHSKIYCAMPRYTMAWDIDNKNEINNGTLIRMLILLPILKEMNINVLYLLPITEYSNRNKKGDVGSPFAIKDFFKLDPNLHDEIVDGMDGFTLNDEFHVLIEAAHMIGIRIVIDFIPRVTARDCNIIVDHPEWFYWIEKNYEKDFLTPEIPGLDFFEECTVDNIDKVYQAESTKKHLSHFVLPPNQLNPEKWEEIKSEAVNEGKEILPLLEEKMGITTPPAHSDWINDVQPIWTDITFWKLYMDNNELANKYLDENQAPYVMFDTIKANKFPAKVPNTELWKLFEDVLEYYSKEFELDGFRFDIGHTLPKELLERLFVKVREYVDSPIFISEDLFNRNHENALKTGYNIMLGSSWNEVSKITKESYENFIKELSVMKIQAYACAETHDTPRIVTRNGGTKLAKSLAIVNSFLPSGVHFILAGYEINESQPMNCGLADNTGGAPIKKAFFNNMEMDWCNENAEDMLEHVIKLNNLRSENEEHVNNDDFEMLPIEGSTVGFSYGRKIVVLFNTDMENMSSVRIEDLNLDDYSVVASSRDDSNIEIEGNKIKMENAEAMLLMSN